ncbi:MAG: hypothetical protein RR540_00110 [Oscillospiraceae bacterium]
MLEFFKDVYYQMNGLDVDKMKEERLQKVITEKEEKILLSSSTKNTIRFVAGLYFFIAILQIITAVKTKDFSRIIKISFLFLLAIVVFILTFFRNKKAEISSLVGVAVFIITNGFVL